MNLKEIEDEFKRMCEMQGPAIRARVPRSHIRSLISRVKELEDCQCSVGNIISETLRCVSCNKEIISQQADLLEIEHLEAKVKELKNDHAKYVSDWIVKWGELCEENTKLREALKHIKQLGIQHGEENFTYCTVATKALGEEHSEPRAKISPEEFEKFCKGLVWGKNENMGTSER